MSVTSRLRRILLCPNAFKGSLTASDATRAMAEGVARAGPYETICLPLADGGDGTLETLVEATGGSLHAGVVRDPLGRPVRAAWGRLGGQQSDTAVIEMAQASGLRLLRPEEFDPLHASTWGTGELMQQALEAGCRRLLVGIGGSATNDGGAGMAQALGFRLLDTEGRELPPGGSALARLDRIEIDGSRIPAGLEVIVACDVNNPLCGPEGAAFVYGPQKGATPAQVLELDAALSHYASVLRRTFSRSFAEEPGAGAAGGLGAGLMAFCGGRLQTGIEMALEVTGFDALLAGCDLVLTGEGRIDGQTARGKVIAGVARRARAAGVPVVALAGSVAEGAEELLRPEGLTAALSIVPGPLSVEEAMQEGYRLLGEAAERTMRLLAAGDAIRN